MWYRLAKTSPDALIFLPSEALRQLDSAGDAELRILIRVAARLSREAAEEEDLIRQLTTEGVSEIDLTGTTRAPVGYGAEIVLRISGKIGKGYEVEEKRVSTAKH